jgi:twitching motility two-component system response regulator PilH
VLSGKRILIIDDEPDVVTYLTTVLEDHGYRALQASSAAAGAAIAREEAPDLICLDIMMPKRSGIALYEELKRDETTRSIPVLFVSAFNRAHAFGQAEFRQLAADGHVPEPQGYLEKPIDVPVFLEVVASLVGTAAARTQVGEGGGA